MNRGRRIAWARRSNAGDNDLAILSERTSKCDKNANKKQEDFSHKKSFRVEKKLTGISLRYYVDREGTLCLNREQKVQDAEYYN